MYGFKQPFVYKYCIFGQSYCTIVVQQSLPWTKFTFKYWILFGLNAKNSLGLDHEIEFRCKSELMLSLVHMLHAFKNIKNRNFSCFGENTEIKADAVFLQTLFCRNVYITCGCKWNSGSFSKMAVSGFFSHYLFREVLKGKSWLNAHCKIIYRGPDPMFTSDWCSFWWWWVPKSNLKENESLWLLLVSTYISDFTADFLSGIAFPMSK